MLGGFWDSLTKPHFGVTSAGWSLQYKLGLMKYSSQHWVGFLSPKQSKHNWPTQKNTQKGTWHIQQTLSDGSLHMLSSSIWGGGFPSRISTWIFQWLMKTLELILDLGTKGMGFWWNDSVWGSAFWLKWIKWIKFEWNWIHERSHSEKEMKNPWIWNGFWSSFHGVKKKAPWISVFLFLRIQIHS